MATLESLKASNFKEITKNEMNKIEGGLRIWKQDGTVTTDEKTAETSFTREWRFRASDSFNYYVITRIEKND